ncbi:M16 family metallopeptidase [Acinetobacter gerneri]|uniref:M16 family metallopeptidase n=1 Tax=Acinetobacter gerneri TaxID=202952 RepID=UPI0028AA6E23|nr:pitrilysin family protein [Acinetobacter gerneri]
MKHLPIFALLLSLSTTIYADNVVEADTRDAEHAVDQPLEIDNDPNQISAIAKLQSLKNLSHKSTFQAPFVQDLANQFKVRTLFVENQDLPMVDIQLTFNAGSARDQEISKQLPGLANMTAKLLAEGTEKYTATQIATIFQRLGAKFSVNAYRDMFVVKLRVMSDPDKLEPALALMLDVIKNSTLNSSGLNMVWNNTKVGQKQVQENPTSLMSFQFYRTIYANHPYAEPISGTQASIRKITVENLQQFKQRFLVAQNMNIAITGKLSAKQALDISERIAGNLPQGSKALPIKEPNAKTGFDIEHITFDSSQASVMMGQLSITKNDPDKVALDLANQMFGGANFNSKLMQELRVKRGLTYGAYSNLTALQASGIFSLSYSTQQNQLMDSIQIAYQTLLNFVQKPIDKKQLEETKEGMLRAFPMNYSSNANTNSQISSIGFYGLNANYLLQYQKQLQALTPEQVQNAIRRHIRPDQMSFVIVSKDLDQEELLQLLNNTYHEFSKENNWKENIKTKVKAKH